MLIVDLFIIGKYCMTIDCKQSQLREDEVFPLRLQNAFNDFASLLPRIFLAVRHNYAGNTWH